MLILLTGLILIVLLQNVSICYHLLSIDPKPIEGYNRVLQQREKMPLMGLLKKGESQLTLCTSLYNTPIYHHTVFCILHSLSRFLLLIIY